jgi:hypothetical protein
VSAREFAAALEKFAGKNGVTQQRVHDTFVASTELVAESLLTGSPLTGSEGVPVDTGNLRASFVQEFTSPTSWQISTNVAYAPYIEDGANDRAFFTLRSQVGNFHFAKLTAASFDRIVEHAAARVLSGKVDT